MPAWQIALEYVKTIGIGSLVGVLVGIVATRSQKSREALQNIHAENYREVVNGYRELSAQLIEVVNSARSAVTTARSRNEILGRIPETSKREAAIKLESMIQESIQTYRSSLNGLESKVAGLIVHRSETNFHTQANIILRLASILETSLTILDEVDASNEEISSASEIFDSLEQSVKLLGLFWDQWKVEAERYAVGLNPVPRFRRRHIYNKRL
ncbi:hypothetical protein [Amycolatopsis pigmentata]|uniref:Uncharacterized protein n=1 Tax=Amycolatopsis pigmentata TaxID=450801 RepID=A0ABW5FSL6_9PSEU